jgi:hypothetical protein
VLVPPKEPAWEIAWRLTTGERWTILSLLLLLALLGRKKKDRTKHKLLSLLDGVVCW